MPTLTTGEIEKRLRERPGWDYRENALVRQYEFEGGFMGSIGFVDRLAEAAEAANHHPDLAISWNKVTVTLSTHSKGGVTDNDFALAAEADRLAG